MRGAKRLASFGITSASIMPAAKVQATRSLLPFNAFVFFFAQERVALLLRGRTMASIVHRQRRNDEKENLQCRAYLQSFDCGGCGNCLRANARNSIARD